VQQHGNISEVPRMCVGLGCFHALYVCLHLHVHLCLHLHVHLLQVVLPLYFNLVHTHLLIHVVLLVLVNILLMRVMWYEVLLMIVMQLSWQGLVLLHPIYYVMLTRVFMCRRRTLMHMHFNVVLPGLWMNIGRSCYGRLMRQYGYVAWGLAPPVLTLLLLRQQRLSRRRRRRWLPLRLPLRLPLLLPLMRWRRRRQWRRRLEQHLPLPLPLLPLLLLLLLLRRSVSRQGTSDVHATHRR
jgi:hypothetical protein